MGTPLLSSSPTSTSSPTTMMKSSSIILVLCIVSSSLVVLSYAEDEALSMMTRNTTTRSILSSTKLGLAWDLKGNIGSLATNKASWYYTWGQTKASTNIEFIPMMWGQKDASSFINSLNAGLFAGSPAILGFNEPDNDGQANMDATTAANLWKQYIQPQGARFRLGAPAVTSAPTGKTWMSKFITACSTCKIDFIPIHWYGSDANLFQQYVQDFYNTFKKPIWVTEWACVSYGGPACTQQHVYDFMGQTTLFLDQAAYVERFSWFGDRVSVVPTENALLNTDGVTRTGLGNQYVSGGHA